MWGLNDNGQLGVNNTTNYSSPVQIPGTTWTKFNAGTKGVMGRKSDGTLWTWGRHESGGGGYPGPSGNSYRSSPTQIPGTTWSNNFHAGAHNQVAVKTDGTLWVWGANEYGTLGQNAQGTEYSSPVQVPGTTWRDASSFSYAIIASKTDNTLWAWGYNADYGQLGLNDRTQYSSPTQIPGTSWDIPMEWNDSWTSVFVRKDV